MPEFFKLGGWGMYPILIIGLIALGAGAFYAVRGESRVRSSLDALVVCLIGATMTALSTDLITVFLFLGSEKAPADPFTFARIGVQGLGESLTPVAMGSVFFTLVYALVALGQRKADARA